MKKDLRKKVRILISISLILTMFFHAGCSINNKDNKSSSISSSFLANEEKEDIELYDEATTLVSEYYKSINLNNSLECFYVFHYLEYYGYLSKDNNNYVYKDMYDIDALGVDVLYTKDTTCRHLSEFYMNTLNKSGHEAYCMPGILYNDGIINDNSINHQWVIVKDDDYITYQDNYNNNVYEKQDNTLVSLFNKSIMIPYEKGITNKKLIATHNSKQTQNIINDLYKNDNDFASQTYVQQQFDSAYYKMNKYNDEFIKFKDKYQEQILNKLP